MRYRQPEKEKVEAKPTKFDTFKIVVTGVEYRPHKESGRTKCLALAKHGMTLKDWFKACAAIGYTHSFAYTSLRKHMEKKEPAFTVSEKNAEGEKFSELSKRGRPKKKLTPKKQAA